jgi:UDP-N-acetylmuramate--alanine ligase
MERVHFIGIGGTGLSAIARVLIERGYVISGSDQQESSLARDLQAIGAQVSIGHTATNVEDADIVIRSSAIPDNNIEVLTAQQQGIPVMKRVDFLGQLLADNFTIAVAGTHGKTTTTAMLAWVMTALNQKPSYIIGGVAKNLGTNAKAGEGPAFVIEADEYDYMFLGLNPRVAVVTNVEHDHPDCFPTLADFQKAFQMFIGRLSADGSLVAYLGDPFCADLLREVSLGGKLGLSYGFEDTIDKSGLRPDYSACNLTPQTMAGYRFDVFSNDRKIAQVSLQVPGTHNVLNALAVIAVCDLLTLPIESVVEALGEFQGTGRRFEVKGEVAGVLVVDDYAHHPTEIKATLSAARDRYPRRPIWAVWQPHTYSRTQQYLEEFCNAFRSANRVLVMDVFAAREEQPAEFSVVDVVQLIQHENVNFTGGIEETTRFILSEVQPDDVVLVLSAGSAIVVSAQVLEGLQEAG